MGCNGTVQKFGDSGMYLYGAELKSIIDKICAVLLAISPIAQHYIGLYENAGFTILLLVFPWLFFRLLGCVNSSIELNTVVLVTIPLIIYHIYSMVVHGTSVIKLLYNGFMIGVIVFIALRCINVGYMIKVAIIVCEIASMGLIMQYFCYYILGFHLQMVPVGLLLEESSSWVLGAQTGLYNIRGGYNGFYRPSSFFLEPSHFALYAIPCLCVLLLSKSVEKSRVVKAMLITIGVVLSTSGLGVVITVLIWGVYILFYSDIINRSNWTTMTTVSSKKVIWCISFLFVLVILYLSVESVRNTVNRLLLDSESSVISGRVNQASLLISRLSGSTVIFGLTDDVSNIIFNLPGFFSTFYKKGLIGIVLSYAYYCSGLIRTKGSVFWLSAIIVLLSFFTAHTHGTFYMLYFVMFLTEGYEELEEQKRREYTNEVVC